MEAGKEYYQSYLFTLRMWDERLSEEQAEWRGKVQHVVTGETHYFRDWSTLVQLLLEMLPPRVQAIPEAPQTGQD